MNKEEVMKKLKGLVMDRLQVEEEQIKPEASFTDDLGADSLDLVEFIMGIEEEFDVEIPDDDAEKLKTVGEALDYVMAKLEAKA